jgi:hypothetical protein
MSDDPERYRYRPSNGTEGEMFMEWWCHRCENDHSMHGPDGEGGCPIILRWMMRDPTPEIHGLGTFWDHAKYGGPAHEAVCVEFVACTQCEAFRDEEGDRWWPAPEAGALASLRSEGE